MSEDQCKTCFYCRPVNAWGEIIPDACWHGETGKDLYTINGNGCSGYEEREKQLRDSLENSAPTESAQ